MRNQLGEFRALDSDHLIHFCKVLYNFLHKFAELEPKRFAEREIVIVPFAPLLDHIEDAARFEV